MPLAGTDQRPSFTLSTLDKGLSVLEAVARADAPHGLTLTELGLRLGMHRTTLFRFLATLQHRGYLERDPMTDRYRLGVQALTLAAGWLNHQDIRQTARPHLEALCRQVQELVHLTILDHSEVVTIDRIEGTHPISLQTEIGNRRSAHCTASGKAILAFMNTDEVERILPLAITPVTSKTVTSPGELVAELAEIRSRGFATDDEGHFDGVRCVAAPVFNYDQRVVASISIAGPVQRITRERMVALGEEVRAVADMVSQHLGYPIQIA
jgi:IclR family acetate operon transcriptional repressor